MALKEYFESSNNLRIRSIIFSSFILNEHDADGKLPRNCKTILAYTYLYPRKPTQKVFQTFENHSGLVSENQETFYNVGGDFKLS